MRRVETYTAQDKTKTFRVRFRLHGKQTSETFDTLRDGQQFAKWLDALGPQGALNQLHADQQDAGIPTLNELAADHFKHKTGITEGTRLDDQRLWDRTWGPLIGFLPANTVDEDAVSLAVNKLAARYSYKSLQNQRGLLAGVCGRAVRKGYLTESPTQHLRLPRTSETEAAEMTFLTPAEFDLLLTHIPAHWQPLVAMLAGTGMRWGEAVALTVGDVDVSSPDPKKWTVRISKAVKRDGSTSQRVIGPPKTKKSRRTVALPPNLVTGWLQPLLNRSRTALLFIGPQGAPASHQNFWMYVWRPSLWKAQHCSEHTGKDCRCASGRPQRCKLHNTPPPPCGCEGTLTKTARIHDLRHSHASWLIAAGIPLPVIQDRLGHESITTTVNVYGHLMPDARAQAAYAASIALSPPPVELPAELPAGQGPR